MTQPATRAEKAVVKQHPTAHCWWNCLEFDWLIWDGPLTLPFTARVIGSGLTKDEAWNDACARLATARKRR